MKLYIFILVLFGNSENTALYTWCISYTKCKYIKDFTFPLYYSQNYANTPETREKIHRKTQSKTQVGKHSVQACNHSKGEARASLFKIMKFYLKNF